MRFLDSCFTARPPHIGSGRCNLIFQVSNRTIRCILDRSARLYGDCMEPDHMAKYSLPLLTDLTENLIQKKQLFMCWPPHSSEGVFGRVSVFCVHPCGLFFENSNIDETIGGGKFCSALTGAAIDLLLVVERPSLHSEQKIATKFCTFSYF